MNEPLVLLILVWAVLFVPGAVRARNTSPHATVGGFERAMEVLRNEAHGRGGGRSLMVPADASRIVARPVDHGVAGSGHRGPSEDPVITRRRAWFIRGLFAIGVTFGFALLLGGAAWLLFTAVVVADAAYITVLRRLKVQRDEARQVVRQLDLEGGVAPVSGQVAAGGEQAWVGSGSVRLRRWDD